MRFAADQLAPGSRFRYLLPPMGIANQQNMIRSIPVLPRPYGIRVRLRPGDPFAKLLGLDSPLCDAHFWTHWHHL